MPDLFVVFEPKAILVPVAVLVGLTFCVLMALPLSRITDARSGRLKPRDFAYGEAASASDLTRLLNRNFMNLLELPQLFYVLCVILYVSGPIPALELWLAWLFVGLRVTHSLIHLFFNRVVIRVIPYALAATTLLVFWGVALWRLMA